MRTMLNMVTVVQIIISYIAQAVYIRLTVFSNFRNSSLFAHFGFYEISTPVMATMLTMPNKVYIIIFNIPQTVYIRHTTFWNFSKLFFENTVCFAHFGFYEVSPPVMRTMPTMANNVYIIISDIAHNVYEI